MQPLLLSPAQGSSGAPGPEDLLQSIRRPMTGTKQRAITGLAQVTLATCLGVAATGCQLLPLLASKDIIRNQSDGPHRWRTYEHQHLRAGHQLGWINNDTVLLVGSRKPEGTGIYAWNPGSRPRMILKNGYRFCFDGNTWTALVGRPKEEGRSYRYTRHQINPQSLATTILGEVPPLTGFRAASYFTCRDEELPELLRGRGFEILRPADGFLDLGQHASPNQYVTLIKADKTTRQSIPILLTNPTFTTVEHVFHANAYLIYSIKFNPDAIDQWKASNQRILWQMKPNGHTTTITIPAGPWLDTGSVDRSFAISRPGVLISSKGLSIINKDKAGVFLLWADKSHSKISTGSSEKLSVAPNGCRVAWAVDRPKPSGIGFFSNISAADLCLPTGKASRSEP